MQVMVHVEPKLSGIDKELLQLREQIDMDKEYIATISAEFESYAQRIKIIEVQIKEKDTQLARFHRCRLCLAENLTPRSREKFVKRTTTKRFSGANTKAEVQEEQSPEELLQASLAAQESHTSEEGKGPLLQPENWHMQYNVARLHVYVELSTKTNINMGFCKINVPQSLFLGNTKFAIFGTS